MHVDETAMAKPAVLLRHALELACTTSHYPSCSLSTSSASLA